MEMRSRGGRWALTSATHTTIAMPAMDALRSLMMLGESGRSTPAERCERLGRDGASLRNTFVACPTIFAIFQASSKRLNGQCAAPLTVIPEINRINENLARVADGQFDPTRQRERQVGGCDREAR